MAQQINPSLAVAIAGQVSVGLIGGAGEEARMRGALITIGLMIQNAADSTLVNDVLAMTERTTCVQYDGGSARFVTRQPSE
jgi:hypothetical protein